MRELHVLTQIVLIPLVMSVIVYITTKRDERVGKALVFLALLYSTLLALWVFAEYSVTSTPIIEEYRWAPIAGLYFGFRADGLSIPVMLIILLLSTATSVYSMAYMEHKSGIGMYFTLYLLYASGMVGTVLATNLIQFYLFWELMLVPSYFLISEWGYGDRERVSFKYFIYTHVGALSLLAGILSTYAFFGTFNIYELPAKLALNSVPSEVIIWIAIAMMIGFFVKMAVVPLHTWLPDAHAEAPTPISVLLSGVMIECGVYAFNRMIISTFSGVINVFYPWLMVLAVITMFYGGMMALVQLDIKRLLAYSSISQMGYMLFGMSTGNYYGVMGSVYHILAHACAKGLLFACAGAIMHQTEGRRNIKELSGLAKRMPYTAVLFTIGVFSLAGVPTLGGFISEFMIFLGGFNTAKGMEIPVVVLAVLCAALTTAYGLWALRRVFFGALREELKNVKEAPLKMIIPMSFLALLSFVFGLYPAPVLKVLSTWISAVVKL